MDAKKKRNVALNIWSWLLNGEHSIFKLEQCGVCTMHLEEKKRATKIIVAYYVDLLCVLCEYNFNHQKPGMCFVAPHRWGLTHSEE